MFSSVSKILVWIYELAPFVILRARPNTEFPRDICGSRFVNLFEASQNDSNVVKIDGRKRALPKILVMGVYKIPKPCQIK